MALDTADLGVARMHRPDLAGEAAGEAAFDRAGQPFAADEGDVARLQQPTQIGQAARPQRLIGPGDAVVHAQRRLDGRLASGGLARVLHRAEYAYDAVVTKALQVLDRPALGLFAGALDHAVDQRLRQLRRLVVGPGQIEGRAELLEHVLHAALAAGQM